jgi:hypothetical protein
MGNQSLVGLMMIDAKFSRNDHDSIICSCDREETETTLVVKTKQ